jgi:hypothetical protein
MDAYISIYELDLPIFDRQTGLSLLCDRQADIETGKRTVDNRKDLDRSFFFNLFFRWKDDPSPDLWRGDENNF